jgi:protein-tyrosine phosphatase
MAEKEHNNDFAASNDCAKDVAVPNQGFIDLHCHLLPGIDDGCRDLGMTLECIRLWMAAGFSGAVCTPHMATTWYPANNPHTIAPLLAEVQAALDEAQLDFQLWPGGEVRLSDRVVDWFKEFGIPTLGTGRCVLIDWWSNDWPEYCTAACRYLIERNYQPILAHPERMGLPEQELLSVVEQLQSLGVWLQGNLNSLSGGEGSEAKRRAEHWFANDHYHVLASDTHEPVGIVSRTAGLGLVKQQNETALQRYLAERPREILAWSGQ